MSSLPSITLRNYRCFDWNNPATLAFGEGFAAIVGPNNSGKSAALRAIYELRSYLSNVVQALYSGNQYKVSGSFLGVSDPSELANDKDDRFFHLDINVPILLGESFPHFKATSVTFEFDTHQSSCVIKKFVARSVSDERHFNDSDINEGTAKENNLITQGTLVDFSSIIKFSQDLSRSKYYPAFRNAINQGASSYYDIPVGTALVANWDAWKAGDIKANRKSIIQIEREICSLLGFRTLEINADQQKKSLNLSIDGRPHKLYEIGSGISQLIIVLAAALISKPSYILIDEPELNLHPSLQLNFLSTLASYSELGVVYSTHSLGLARSTASRIYSSKRNDDGSSKIEIFGDKNVNLSQWLGELSYSGRMELGCDKILLVEGPTDVLFFQEFLRKLGKDSKYIVMQLGGSSLINEKISTHLGELTRLVDSSSIKIYIDSEKTSADAPLSPERSSFISECRNFGIDAQSSKRRAIENYLEAKAIKAVLGDDYEPLEPYQLLKDAKKKWRKSENWRIVKETKFDDISQTDLGHFLLSL